MARFKTDVAQKALANTVKLANVKADDFDTVFYPGGHRPMSGAKVLGATPSRRRPLCQVRLA
jgi:putative intracellular protease/amidase